MKSLSVMLFVGVCLVGCGDDAGLKGEPLRLNSLKGTYALNDQGCQALVDESKVRLAGCQYDDRGRAVDITGEGTFGESRVTFSGQASETNNDQYDDGCGTTRVCTLVTSGSATKQEGRTDEGPFSSFAGKWDGELSAQMTCGYPDKPTDADSYCDDDVSISALTFSLDITGRIATLEYSGDKDGSGRAVATEDFIDIEDLTMFEKL